MLSQASLQRYLSDWSDCGRFAPNDAIDTLVPVFQLLRLSAVTSVSPRWWNI